MFALNKAGWPLCATIPAPSTPHEFFSVHRHIAVGRGGVRDLSLLLLCIVHFGFVRIVHAPLVSFRHTHRGSKEKWRRLLLKAPYFYFTLDLDTAINTVFADSPFFYLFARLFFPFLFLTKSLFKWSQLFYYRMRWSGRMFRYTSITVVRNARPLFSLNKIKFKWNSTTTWNGVRIFQNYFQHIFVKN